MLAGNGHSALLDPVNNPSSPENDSIDSPSSVSDVASLNGYAQDVLREMGMTPIRTNSNGSGNNVSSPKSNIYTPPIQPGTNNNAVLAALSSNIAETTGMSINIIGIPQNGAKSRVETQIKLGIQLIGKAGKVTDYSHLRLPSHMVAKERLRKNSMPTDALPQDDSKGILSLEATVFCSSDPSKDVLTCASCIQRERKRSQRKKENRFPNNVKDIEMEDEEIIQREQKRILLFNCTEYLDFSTGDAVLPTRITCYCRHHAEKTGFRIMFVLKDASNATIAMGVSAPIMITDDHKSSKKAAPNGKTKSSRSSPTHDEEQTVKRRSTAPYQKTTRGPAKQVKDSEKDKSSNGSASLHPLQMAFLGKLERDLNENGFKMEDLEGDIGSSSQKASSAIFSSIDPASTYSPSQPADNTTISPSALMSFTQSSSVNSPSPISTKQNPSVTPFPFTFDQSKPSSSGPIRVRQHKSSVSNTSSVSPPINSDMLNDVAMHFNSPTTSNDFMNFDGPEDVPMPKMRRLIPGEGPMYGGVEITILGDGFYNGLTCLFGENPAIPTHYWSPTTLVCLLPPSPCPGPVVVSFKEHPLAGLDGTEGVQLFTYQDDSDRALMELALQVVGLKMTGKLENAKQIAMRIVGGTDNGSGQSSAPVAGTSVNMSANSSSVGLSRQQAIRAMTVLQNRGKSRTQDFESMLIQFLRLLDFETQYSNDSISFRNRNGHTLLHLAVLLGFHRLVNVLIHRGIDVNSADRNGYTALHFSAWMGRMQISRMLLEAHADDEMRTNDDQSPVDLALSRDQTDVATLLTSHRETLADETSSTEDGAEDLVNSGRSISSQSSMTESVLDDEGADLPWLEAYIDSDGDGESDDADDERFRSHPRPTRVRSRTSSRTRRHGVRQDGRTLSLPGNFTFTRMTATSDSDAHPGEAEDGVVDAEVVSGGEDQNALSSSDSDEKAVKGDMASVWLQKTLSHLQPSKRAFQMPNMPTLMPTIKKPTNLTFPAMPSMPSMPSFKHSLPEFPSLPELPAVFAWQMSMPNVWPPREEAVDSDGKPANRWWSFYPIPKSVPMYRPEQDMQPVQSPSASEDDEVVRGSSKSTTSRPVRWAAYDLPDFFGGMRRPSEIPKADQQLMAKLRLEQRKKDRMLWVFWIPCLIAVLSFVIIRYSPLYAMILRTMDSFNAVGSQGNPLGNSRYGVW